MFEGRDCELNDRKVNDCVAFPANGTFYIHSIFFIVIYGLSLLTLGLTNGSNNSLFSVNVPVWFLELSLIYISSGFFSICFAIIFNKCLHDSPDIIFPSQQKEFQLNSTLNEQYNEALDSVFLSPYSKNYFELIDDLNQYDLFLTHDCTELANEIADTNNDITKKQNLKSYLGNGSDTNKSTQDTLSLTQLAFESRIFDSNPTSYYISQINEPRNSVLSFFLIFFNMNSFILVLEALGLAFAKACLKFSLLSSPIWWCIVVTIAHYNSILKLILCCRLRSSMSLVILGGVLILIIIFIQLQQIENRIYLCGACISAFILTCVDVSTHFVTSKTVRRKTAFYAHSVLEGFIGIVILLVLLCISSTQSIVIGIIDSTLTFNFSHILLFLSVSTGFAFSLATWFLNKACILSFRDGEILSLLFPLSSLVIFFWSLCFISTYKLKLIIFFGFLLCVIFLTTLYLSMYCEEEVIFRNSFVSPLLSRDFKSSTNVLSACPLLLIEPF